MYELTVRIARCASSIIVRKLHGGPAELGPHERTWLELRFLCKQELITALSFLSPSFFTTQYAVTNGKSFSLPLHFPNSYSMMSKICKEPLRMTPSGG